ncbi:MAG: hypothetical protein H7841_16955 [Magnetospirillum sp. WYHS-4]
MTEGRLAHLIYLLHLVGIPLAPALVVGAGLAFWNRDVGPDWVRGHYRYQIGSFLGTLVAGALVTLVLRLLPDSPAGLVVIGLWLVWFVARCVRGMRLVGRGEPPPNPTTPLV